MPDREPTREEREARDILTVAYIEHAGPGYVPTPPQGTRWEEWLLALEAFIPHVARALAERRAYEPQGNNPDDYADAALVGTRLAGAHNLAGSRHGDYSHECDEHCYEMLHESKITPADVEAALRTIAGDMAKRGLFVRDDFGRAHPLAIAELVRAVLALFR